MCAYVFEKNTLDGRFAGNFGCFSLIRVDQARNRNCASWFRSLAARSLIVLFFFVVVVGKHSFAITATALLYYGIGRSQRCLL